MSKSLGDFIGGAFLEASGDELVSVNPARDGEPVFETLCDPARVDVACAAAAAAAPAWAALTLADRQQRLEAFRRALEARVEPMADAILKETGKIRGEARGEARSLVSRFGIVAAQIARDMSEGPVEGEADAVLRYHPHGVVGVIGPYNYPLHLCHAHVVPALMMGNTVVIKPSEIAPLAGQRYAEAAAAAGLPPGVINVVQGRGASGAALLRHPALRGLCFTGSWPTGRRILEAALDRPEVLVALEMGGKNVAVVLEDADLRQAAHEIAVGGYLTAGQRCTATDRVLVHRDVIDDLLELLIPLVNAIRCGDPDDPNSFAGPLATRAGWEAVQRALRVARAFDAEPLVAGGPSEGGFFMQPSLHRLPDGLHHVQGYTDEELFAPDLCVESFGDDDEAIDTLNTNKYGLANSVFTTDRARFERIFRRTRVGILNYNRTTNQASARLPFGGVGRSGNFRPAGANAARNVVFPVASREQLPGELSPHPMLAPHLPLADLDALEERHLAEDAAEAEHDLLAAPRPMRRVLPTGGSLPRSEAWLKRLYAGERVPREKKPTVFDHRRSAGPWLVSVDNTPLSVLDGMSQTATFTGGFAAEPIVRGFVEGAFAGTLLGAPDTSFGEHPAAEAFAEALRSRVPGLDHVTFANSGAEANEKALALCRRACSRPDAQRVLAFEGSFHGRTLLSLHATWNPVKRGPFELAGYEARFAPFPVGPGPDALEITASSELLGAIAAQTMDEVIAAQDADPLLADELASLRAVESALRSGEIFAVIVEPMQCEGGDRYASARFFQGLRVLTRKHDTALIFDEVQTGFGLGGPFVWHSRYELVDAAGAPDTPDAVTFAKRAQVGAVVSRFEDPEPTATHTASLVRGRIHAEMVDPERARSIEQEVRARLEDIARRYPELVGMPHACGFAFAFDLPTPAHLGAYLKQRFWRGAVVFGAGSRTVRYRLSNAWKQSHLELLFTTIRQTLSWLDAHPGKTPPAWEDFPAPEPRKKHRSAPPVLRLRGVEVGDDVTALLDRVTAIEAATYEPARRDPREKLQTAFEDPHGVITLAEVQREDERWDLVGFALATPLENVTMVEGPDLDPMREHRNALYSLSITIAEEARGLGLGRVMKRRQIEQARAARWEDGSPRFRYICGRNRVGSTAPMMHLNRSFGAHTIAVCRGAYGEAEAEALYYRIPLGPLRPDPTFEAGAPVSHEPHLDLADGISRPLGTPPESLVRCLESGTLAGPAINKLTVMNYITPPGVRAIEWVSGLTPALPHLFLTSCRDELVDKSLRLLRYHRKAATVAIGFEGGYLGHTSAAARSLSDPETHSQGLAHFDWPRAPHPAEVGTEACVAALRAIVQGAGGPDQVLGLLFEPVQERRGRVIPDDFWPALEALRAELGLPVVVFETATACYRSGRGPFYTSAAPFTPDLLAWWAGGQLGFIHCSRALYVSKPLTMVSTWDGDELCLVRTHHQLMAARHLDLEGPIRGMDVTLEQIEAGFEARGVGLYRVIDTENDTEVGVLRGRFEEAGLRVREYPGGCFALVPHLDHAMEAVEALSHAIV